MAEAVDILMRLAAAGFLGACIGFERRVHHKAIGIAGMVLIAIGSTTYMLLGRHFADADPSSISRTLQGFLSGIGFLGGAVIFKSGFEVKGIAHLSPDLRPISKRRGDGEGARRGLSDGADGDRVEYR
jgi:putative Mg2+ transporter-C (MgtC) family protein